MSITYPADPTKPYGDRLEIPGVQPSLRPEAAMDEPFVPVYARRGKARGGQGRIKTWMILAPVAALVLGGIGAMLVLDRGEDVAAPLAEPAATAPVLPATATDAAVAPLNSAATSEPVSAAPAPAAAPARDAAPLRRIAPAPVRREAARAPSPPASARTVTPARTVTGPQAYTPAPAPAAPTATLNTAPARPAPTPPPIVVVQPVG